MRRRSLPPPKTQSKKETRSKLLLPLKEELNQRLPRPRPTKEAKKWPRTRPKMKKILNRNNNKNQPSKKNPRQMNLKLLMSNPKPKERPQLISRALSIRRLLETS